MSKSNNVTRLILSNNGGNAKAIKLSKRGVQSSELVMNLVLSGRSAKCEVPGCSHMSIENLDIHHIVPVTVKAIHSVDNLVILCSDHHALVERYYWWERSKLLPSEAREVKQIARMFKARAVNPSDMDRLKARTKELWTLLNQHPKCINTDWWKRVYTDARDWATKQEILRVVDPKNAIIEDPWFKERKVEFY